MGKVCLIEISALVQRRVQVGVQDMRTGRMVVDRPFMEMICDIERGWVWRSIFEIDHDDLKKVRGIVFE